MGSTLASQPSFNQKSCFCLSWAPGFWLGLGYLKKLPRLELGKRLDKMILRSLPALIFCQGFVTFSKLQFSRLSGCLRHLGISRWLQGRVSSLKTLKQAHNSQSSFLCRDGPAHLQIPYSDCLQCPCSFGEQLPSHSPLVLRSLMALSSVLTQTPNLYPCADCPPPVELWLNQKKVLRTLLLLEQLHHPELQTSEGNTFLQGHLFSTFKSHYNASCLACLPRKASFEVRCDSVCYRY